MSEPADTSSPPSPPQQPLPVPPQAAASGNKAAMLVVAESLLLVGVTAVWAGPAIFDPGKLNTSLMSASVLLLIIEAITLLAIGPVRTMALATFAQCVRTRVGLLFIVLLAAALCVLPAVLKGDGTLAGKIKTFLAYSTSFTLVLLSVVTIFLSSSVIYSDIHHKQIFITAAKPLPRWQYVLGRWLGVVMLDLLLLALAAGAIYATAQYFRIGAALNGEDRRMVETEIFTARGHAGPDPDKTIEEKVQHEVERLQHEGAYAGALESWKMRTAGDPEAARAKLLDQLRKQVTEADNAVGPGGGLTWTFSGISTAGQEIRGPGTILGVNPRAPQLRVQAERRLLRKLLQDYPVRINDAQGTVTAVESDDFVVTFSPGVLEHSGLRQRVNSPVEVQLDPVIQVRYRATVTGDLPMEKLSDGQDVMLMSGVWEIENLTSHRRDWLDRRDPVGRPNTLTISARAIGDDGRLIVRFTNQTATSVRIAANADDIAVLFPQGGFEWNFARVCLLMAMQLVFLAAVGILAGSVLSFQVACLMCFTMLPFSLARSFLVEAVKYTPGYNDWVTGAGHYLVAVMTLVLPDFASTWQSDMLVDGLMLPWQQVGQTGVVTIAIRCLLVLAVACYLFRRRELARVQV